MITAMLKVSADMSDVQDIQAITAAADIILAGGLVAMPTETVYGLAANAFDEKAVLSVFSAKGRPADNPLILHICDMNMLEDIAYDIPDKARELAHKFWPGPLTMIFKRKDTIPAICSAGLDTVAVRFPAHSAARALINAAGVPLAAPSANCSGRPSPTSARHVENDLLGRIDAIIDGGECEIGLESTVISFDGEPMVLRPGGITPEQIASVIGSVKVDEAVLKPLDLDEQPNSPGMKYTHYAPRTTVILCEGNRQDYIIYVNDQHERHGDICALCPEEISGEILSPCLSLGHVDDAADQSHRLFAALREVDGLGSTVCYIYAPQKQGLGLAVYNRLLRASGFNVIQVGKN